MNSTNVHVSILIPCFFSYGPVFLPRWIPNEMNEGRNEIQWMENIESVSSCHMPLRWCLSAPFCGGWGRGDDVSKGHTNDEATAPHGRVMRWGGRSCLYRRPAQLDVHNESKPRCTASCKFRLDFSRKCWNFEHRPRASVSTPALARFGWIL